VDILKKVKRVSIAIGVMLVIISVPLFIVECDAGRLIHQAEGKIPDVFEFFDRNKEYFDTLLELQRRNENRFYQFCGFSTSDGEVNVEVSSYVNHRVVFLYDAPISECDFLTDAEERAIMELISTPELSLVADVVIEVYPNRVSVFYERFRSSRTGNQTWTLIEHPGGKSTSLSSRYIRIDDNWDIVIHYIHRI